MKNKKRILIIVFVVILFLLVLLLAFFAGKAAGKKYGDVTLGSANEESTQEENADNAQPAVSASAPPEEITDTETTPVPQEDKPQVTETPQATQVPQATEQPVPNGALEAKPTEEPTTGNVGEEVTEEHNYGEETIFTLYAHLAEIDVVQGQEVIQGTIIGTQGGDPLRDKNPGSSTGTHLHFEIRLENKSTIDPAPYLFTAI